MRLAILTSHPIQYYSPLFRALARRVEVKVYFAHRATPEDQARAGFETPFAWDLSLTEGFDHTFLENVARRPGTDHYAGCDTPEICESLKRGRFDALLLTGWRLKSFRQGLKAAKQLGIPTMVRGDSQLETPRNLLKRLGKEIVYPHFLRRFDAACYVGERSRAYYRHYKYPQDRLFFSPHCVDTERFGKQATKVAGATLREHHGISQDAKVVLFAGKLTPFKRPLDLVYAVAQLRCDGLDVQLLVAGSGELRSAMQTMAQQEDVPLHLPGFLNQTEMPAAYAAANVLALPSDGRETWGLVCNEALACGTPIVVSDQAGCAPDLASGFAGSTYPMGDIDKLADQLWEILLHPPTGIAMSEVSHRYSLFAAAEGIVAASTVLANNA